MSNFDDFCTNWKLRVGAFNRYKTHQNWIHVSKVMAISKFSKKSSKSLKNHKNRQISIYKGPFSTIRQPIERSRRDLPIWDQLSNSPYLDLYVSNFDEFCTDWKLRFRAFNRYKNHQNSMYASKVMTISNFDRKSSRIQGPCFFALPPLGGGGLFQKSDVSQI